MILVEYKHPNPNQIVNLKLNANWWDDLEIEGFISFYKGDKFVKSIRKDLIVSFEEINDGTEERDGSNAE